ncbi:acyl-CoA dehydrogenase family protein [Roseibium sp. MMSF_3412]|uniref:acyl-CoA dehydrogenase family protein n=1 Tax=Roseibium sp. MMSF_3412 TaxID=3046712 RepID=UPI00273E527B|nr:acyl-CoA dehydrogenase family protein [Roseibium sp. MMSF_3412]
MSTAALTAAETPESLAEQTASAVDTLDRLLDLAAQRVRALVTADGRVSSRLMEQEQRATHGLAWLATYVESLRQLDAYAQRLSTQGKYGTLEERIVQLGFAEYLAQIFGGIPMNQGEFVRLADLGISSGEARDHRTPDIDALIETGNTPAIRTEIAALIRDQAGHSTFGDPGLDETMEQIRNEMRKFAEGTVTPHAHEWHMKNEYIPLEVVGQMSELGVFGLTIPEEYGGLGLGKEAMCVVSEELSRAYIGVGSLGTRSEIAAELILCGGTEEQKQHWLPKIASGEILPTAVFTEPNTGSDLASLKTRAVKDGDTWKVSGNKTWITHPVRADIMTLLARTNPDEPGYKGLSMFIAEKPRGTDEDPFPAEGMSGGEIEVLGYRGMKEYEIAFDGFEVAGENLLGQVEGEGFKQLMQTFEGARIQTAARALGVAQSALDLGLRYAEERVQFGKSLIHFPRVADKLALMTAELMIARQLTYFSSWQKDSGKRCDLEAGMAKLLGARVAWAAADNALQIHGGNGFALEYAVSRVLCDARILNIFEGAAEIQAQVIARRLLETRGNQ